MMWLSKGLMDNLYDRGKSAALAGIPPNIGYCGKHDHYYRMAYHAGYSDALGDLKGLKRRLAEVHDE